VFPLIAFGRSVRSRSRTTQDTLAASAAFAAETISASRTIQSFNAEVLANSRYNDAVEKAYQGARAAISARAVLTAVAISFVFGSVVAILWYGAHGVLTGTISGGTLSQFVLYAVIAASSLGQLSEVWGELSQAGGAAERLSELLQEQSPVENPLAPVALPAPARGEASFESVAFHYPQGAGKPILSDLSFRVAPGETVAIVGPSGAGKSTVFSLMMRFYDPQAGRITVDGVDIRSVTLEDLRSRLAIVPQDVAIFASSIHDNIAFGKPDATREEVRAAASAAQADGFISRLHDGYDTVVGERGVTLSGGQRQRIAIARAILRDAPILLLDEATSALDAESETLVQKALDELIRKRTTIVIAHRLATVLKADRILVMDEGRIIEEGTHQSLSRQAGLYAKLARLQFETGSEEVVTLVKSS
jgi:ATP-binding cassette subfamily B protein